MNQHPDPSLIRKAMDLMEMADAAYHISVRMDHGIVSKVPFACGTVACHGGVYLLATTQHPRWEKVIVQGFSEPQLAMVGDRGLQITFNRGSARLAHDLGFLTSTHLSEWAIGNPDLWGNSKGAFMFSSQGNWAFGKSVDDTLTVADIVAHWRGVADRIEAT